MKFSPNIEEYLETLWIIEEKGKKIAKISEIAEELKIAPPSVVEMSRKMEGKELVEYKTREGIKLTKKGRKIARQIVRNHRLTELLLTEILHMKVDENAVCGLEHYISEEISDAVCTTLDHPRKCPHGHSIPPGKCCR